jgi:cytochrome b561
MMAYREKTAWLALIAMALAYGPFFAVLQQPSETGHGIGRFLLLFGIASGVRVAIELGGRIVLALRLGAEAREPADERDRAIAARSAHFGYVVLLFGMIVVGVMMPFGSQGIAIVGPALLAIVIAETVRNLAIVLGYRLGWQ